MTSFQAHKFTQKEIVAMKEGRQTQFHVPLERKDLDGVVEFRKISNYGQFTGYNSAGCVVISRMSSPYNIMDTVYAYCGSDEGLYAELQIREVSIARLPDANKKLVWCWLYSFCVLDAKSGTSAVNTNNSAVHPDILNNWTSLVGKNIQVRDIVNQNWRIATLVGVVDGVVFASLAGNSGLAYKWAFAQPVDSKRYVWDDLADSRVVPCRAKNGDKNDNTGWQEGVLVRVILGHEYPWVVRINGTLAHFQHCQVRREVNAVTDV